MQRCHRTSADNFVIINTSNATYTDPAKIDRVPQLVLALAGLSWQKAIGRAHNLVHMPVLLHALPRAEVVGTAGHLALLAMVQLAV